MRRVVVTGLGCVSPLGVGTHRTWNRLIRGDCGIVSLDDHKEHGEAFKKLPSRVAGLVPKGNRADGGWNPSEWLDKSDMRRMADFTQYAIAAAEEALQDSGYQPATDEEREAFGVSLGSGIGAFSDVYNTSNAFAAGGHHKVSPLFVPRLLINLAAGHVATRYQLRGPNLSPTTACTTGAHALTHAYQTIAAPSSSTTAMLAGASEACIHPLAVSGFARARSLATAFNTTPALSSRPFDRRRAGFVIAEGAAVLVLEELQHARARGAAIYAELAGHGESGDAFHMTAPEPTGRGAVLAMRQALRSARVPPRDVGYVNAHATSTLLGDAVENRAIRAVLCGDGGLDPRRANVSSTKGAVGHLLGAAGALEALLTVLALRHGVLPPTLNLERAGDPDGAAAEAAGEEATLFTRGPADCWDMNYVPREAQEMKDIKAALTNSFGFGGTNASLCFTRFDG